jgi:hypothetical protein
MELDWASSEWHQVMFLFKGVWSVETEVPTRETSLEGPDTAGPRVLVEEGSQTQPQNGQRLD